MTPIVIRPATAADEPFLRDMLLESVFISDDERSAWRRDPQLPPELRRYLDAWGRRGDAGLVAQDTEGFRSAPPGIGSSSHPIAAMGSSRTPTSRSSRSRWCPSIAAAASEGSCWRRWRGRHGATAMSA